MTKWDDTVLSDEQLEEDIRKDYKDFRIKDEADYIRDILIWTRGTQAEISFKAGVEFGNQESYEIGIDEGKTIGLADGIKTVVDWIENNNHYNDYWDTIAIENNEWNTQLKEWGIEEKQD